MIVKIRFYASYREVTGTDEIDFEIEEGTSLSDLIERIKHRYPVLRMRSDEIIVSLNGKSLPLSTRLREGDIVSFLPPVTGG